MTQEYAIKVLIDVAAAAQRGGLLTLDEAAVVAEAVKVALVFPVVEELTQATGQDKQAK